MAIYLKYKSYNLKMVSYAKFKDPEYCSQCLSETFFALKNCSFCNMQACALCVGKHANSCPNKPPPTEKELKSIEESKKMFEEMEKAKTEVSDDPEQNCCQCGYKRSRNVITWSIYISPSTNDNCSTCSSKKCRSCLLSNHYNHNRNHHTCLKNKLQA